MGWAFAGFDLRIYSFTFEIRQGASNAILMILLSTFLVAYGKATGDFIASSRIVQAASILVGTAKGKAKLPSQCLEAS